MVFSLLSFNIVFPVIKKELSVNIQRTNNEPELGFNSLK